MNVFITGTNRGIGLALTRVFLERGDTVFAGTRRASDSPALHKLEKKFPDDLKIQSLDVTSHPGVTKTGNLLNEIETTIDVLINNAGVLIEGVTANFESLQPEYFSRTFAVNVTGVALVTREFLPLIRRSRNLRIVNISSGAGSISTKKNHNYYCYGASKAALNHLTVGLAHEFRADNIIVTAISPGWVRTDMGGSDAELSAEESASAMAETITHLTMDDTGTFMGPSGNSEDYCW